MIEYVIYVVDLVTKKKKIEKKKEKEKGRMPPRYRAGHRPASVSSCKSSVYLPLPLFTYSSLVRHEHAVRLDNSTNS
jgi:hypothetical protein